MLNDSKTFTMKYWCLNKSVFIIRNWGTGVKHYGVLENVFVIQNLLFLKSWNINKQNCKANIKKAQYWC